MRKDDEELLERVAKEEKEHGLEFEDHDGENFHKVVKRLIDLPPAPKQKKKQRGEQRARGRQTKR